MAASPNKGWRGGSIASPAGLRSVFLVACLVGLPSVIMQLCEVPRTLASVAELVQDRNDLVPDLQQAQQVRSERQRHRQQGRRAKEEHSPTKTKPSRN